MISYTLHADKLLIKKIYVIFSHLMGRENAALCAVPDLSTTLKFKTQTPLNQKNTATVYKTTTTLPAFLQLPVIETKLSQNTKVSALLLFNWYNKHTNLSFNLTNPNLI